MNVFTVPPDMNGMGKQEIPASEMILCLRSAFSVGRPLYVPPFHHRSPSPADSMSPCRPVIGRREFSLFDIGIVKARISHANGESGLLVFSCIIKVFANKQPVVRGKSPSHDNFLYWQFF